MPTPSSELPPRQDCTVQRVDESMVPEREGLLYAAAAAAIAEGVLPATAWKRRTVRRPADLAVVTEGDSAVRPRR